MSAGLRVILTPVQLWALRETGNTMSPVGAGGSEQRGGEPCPVALRAEN